MLGLYLGAPTCSLYRLSCLSIPKSFSSTQVKAREGNLNDMQRGNGLDNKIDGNGGHLKGPKEEGKG